MAIKYRELKKMAEGLGAAETTHRLREAMDSGQLKPKDFSLRRLAETFMGAEFIECIDPESRDYIKAARMLAESGSAVDSTSFSNITGQIVYSQIMQGYNGPNRLATQLVPTTSTQLSGEKIPGVQKVSDQGDDLITNEQEPYPTYGIGEDYIETAETLKRGLKVNVTLEAVYFDRTNLVLQRASEVGDVLGTNKEKRLWDVILGITNNYKQTGTEYNTYNETATGTLPANYLTNNQLQDYTDLDAVEQLFDQFSDPYTGEPIVIEKPDMIVAKALKSTARHILNSTEIRKNTDTNTITNLSPVDKDLVDYNLMTSTYVRRRLVANAVSAAVANNTYIIGDIGKAFTYMENWPITIASAPTNNQLMFDQDIVYQYKASERGVAQVMDPRYVVKCDTSGA